MSNLRLFLYPFSIIYDGITRARNYMYDQEIFKSTKFPIPIIVIGNLSVGGTGKTPHTEFVLSILTNDYNPAVLSRGYGRKTKGYILATSNSSAAEIGDEPKQIKTHFPELPVAVCENRALGVFTLLKDTDTNVVVLDDAFQHRAISGSLNIIITPYNNRFTSDYILPAGNLRESRSNKNRADIIVVSKCPLDMNVEEKDEIIREINPNKNQKVFFTGISYQKPIRISGSKTELKNAKGLLVTGIVNPKPLQEHLSGEGHQLELLSFPDHYFYSKKDLEKIQNRLIEMGPDSILFTTSKDASKLRPLLPEFPDINAFEIPIGIEVLFSEEPNFKQTITNHVSEVSRSS